MKQTSQHDIKDLSKNYVHSLVTENEVENVINTLKGKFSAGFDEIPEFLVKQCFYYIKKLLTQTLNITVKFEIFPDLMKIAKIRLFLKTVIN